LSECLAIIAISLKFSYWISISGWYHITFQQQTVDIYP
jgi:hypothetical protein